VPKPPDPPDPPADPPDNAAGPVVDEVAAAPVPVCPRPVVRVTTTTAGG